MWFPLPRHTSWTLTAQNFHIKMGHGCQILRNQRLFFSERSMFPCFHFVCWFWFDVFVWVENICIAHWLSEVHVSSRFHPKSLGDGGTLTVVDVTFGHKWPLMCATHLVTHHSHPRKTCLSMSRSTRGRLLYCIFVSQVQGYLTQEGQKTWEVSVTQFFSPTKKAQTRRSSCTTSRWWSNKRWGRIGHGAFLWLHCPKGKLDKPCGHAIWQKRKHTSEVKNAMRDVGYQCYQVWKNPVLQTLEWLTLLSWT